MAPNLRSDLECPAEAGLHRWLLRPVSVYACTYQYKHVKPISQSAGCSNAVDALQRVFAVSSCVVLQLKFSPVVFVYIASRAKIAIVCTPD